MKALSLTSRILLAYTVVFGILLTVFSLVIYRSSSGAELAMLDAKLQRFAADIRSELEEAAGDVAEHEKPDMPDSLQVYAGDLPGARYLVIAPGGLVLAADSVLQAAVSVRDSLTQPVERVTSSLGGIPYRIIRSSVKVDEHSGYLLEVAAPMTEAEDRLAHLRLLLLISGPASVLLAALAAFLITRSSLRPIVAMTTTARTLSALNLDQRISLPAARDEVRTLAETLNGMIERIDNAFRSQRQFVADASHELCTPLTVITTELEFAEQRARGEARKSIHIALSEADRLARIADGLLLLARLDASSLRLAHEPVHLNELLEECVQHMTGPAQKKGIDIDLSTDGPVELAGDRARLKSVILNLLDNAIRYSPEDTRVTVSLENARPESGCATVRVSDQGFGIPAEDLPRIFQRFYRPSAPRSDEEGSGLGLAIVDSIVRLHGGTVAAQSTPGKGSIFTVCLPSVAPA